MEPPSPSAVRILNGSSRRPRLGALRSALCHVLGDRVSKVEVALVDDTEIRRLNRELRGLDEATDVLTFPAPEFPGAPLGEIAISVEYAARQAAARNISLEDELAYLGMHGALHLLGFEDEDDEPRRRMHAEMHRLGVELGLPEQPEWHSVLHEVAS
jgi:rRNA maturation RNase YbeY